MIIFTSNPNIVTDRFISIYGISYIKGFNLTSYLNIFPTLNALYVDEEVLGVRYDSPEFDVYFAAYLQNSINALADLNSIVDPVFNHGGISIVTIDNSSDYRALVNEAIAQAIYYRYEYEITFAETEEDLIYEMNKGHSFTLNGLMRLQQDIMMLGSVVMTTMDEKDLDDIAEGTSCC